MNHPLSKWGRCIHFSLPTTRRSEDADSWDTNEKLLSASLSDDVRDNDFDALDTRCCNDFGTMIGNDINRSNRHSYPPVTSSLSLISSDVSAVLSFRFACSVSASLKSIFLIFEMGKNYTSRQPKVHFRRGGEGISLAREKMNRGWATVHLRIPAVYPNFALPVCAHLSMHGGITHTYTHTGTRYTHIEDTIPLPIITILLLLYCYYYYCNWLLVDSSDAKQRPKLLCNNFYW